MKTRLTEPAIRYVSAIKDVLLLLMHFIDRGGNLRYRTCRLHRFINTNTRHTVLLNAHVVGYLYLCNVLNDEATEKVLSDEATAAGFK